MYIIAPLSNCASPPKRDRFLEYISRIAPVTHAHEPKCHAYAWFRSAEDNDAVPNHWVRGFEVYEDIEANTVTHRASTEYKAFRAAVAEEGLLGRPSDLRYWRPLSGFLGRTTQDSIAIGKTKSEAYIVVEELTPQAGKKGSVLRQLEGVVREAEQDSSVLSFWVLHRGEGDEDERLLVFIRCESKDTWAGFMARDAVAKPWETMKGMLDSHMRTTWVECLGFLGR